MFGNSVSIFILSCKELKNPFNRLLVLLACFDSFFICFVILDYTLVRGNQNILNILFFKPFSVFNWPFDQSSTIYAYLFTKALYPLNNIFLCCSIYIIIAIAFERFLWDSLCYSPSRIGCLCFHVSLDCLSSRHMN